MAKRAFKEKHIQGYKREDNITGWTNSFQSLLKIRRSQAKRGDGTCLINSNYHPRFYTFNNIAITANVASIKLLSFDFRNGH